MSLGRMEARWVWNLELDSFAGVLVIQVLNQRTFLSSFRVRQRFGILTNKLQAKKAHHVHLAYRILFRGVFLFFLFLRVRILHSMFKVRHARILIVFDECWSTNIVAQKEKEKVVLPDVR